MANEAAIDPDLAAAVVGTLDVHHVPMYGGPVSIVGNPFVRASRRHVNPSVDFFVEQDAAGGVFDVRIEVDGELADVARARVGIQHLIQHGRPFRRFGVRGLDAAIFERQLDEREPLAVVVGGAELDRAVDRFFDRGGVALAVWDVVFAGAGCGAESVDAQREVGVLRGADDPAFFGVGHELLQGAHRFRHAAIVEQADVSVERLELRQRHAARRGEGFGRRHGHEPARVVDAVFRHRPHGLLVQRAEIVRQRHLREIVVVVDADVALHGFHPFQHRRAVGLEIVGMHGDDLSVDGGAAAVDQDRIPLGRGDFSGAGVRQGAGVGAAVFDPDIVTGLRLHGVAHELVREGGQIGVIHVWLVAAGY